MNEHILLVIKFLKDPLSVTLDELEENSRNAWDAYDAAYLDASPAYLAAAAAADAAAADAAAAAAHAVADDAVDDAVDEYFDITGEDREEYERALT